jgi:hypothetical protein
MTVKELISKLKECNPKAIVCIAQAPHDREVSAVSDTSNTENGDTGNNYVILE